MTHKKQKINRGAKVILESHSFQKMPIHPQLSPYVKSIEIEPISRNHTQSVLPYNVLPDFTVVMGFQYQGSLYFLEKQKKKRLDRCGLSGLQTHSRTFQAKDDQTKSILVRLYPWAINAFFNEAAYHFTDQALGLNEIIKSSKILHLEEQLVSEMDLNKLSYFVQIFLNKLLTESKKKLPSVRIIALIQQLLSLDKVGSIAQLAQSCGLSKRNFERQFKSTIGLSPKKFLRLMQFQKALHHLRNGANWEQIIESLNYYDQAHFINSFKEFSGITPSQFKFLHA